MQCRYSTASVVTTALILAATSTAAVADDDGFYIGAGVGGASTDQELNFASAPPLPNVVDEDDTAFKVFAGYTFDLPLIDLAVEAAWNQFGEPELELLNDSELTTEPTGLSAFGIVTLDAGLIDIFGKVGVVAWSLDTAIDGSTLDFLEDSGTDPAYGLGAAFGIGSVEIRAEYERFDFGDADADVSMLSASLLWRF